MIVLKNKKEILTIWWIPVFVFILEGEPIYYSDIKLSNGTVALVLGVMYYFYGMKDGVCKASIATIAKKTGSSVKTVERCIHALEELGYVKDTTPTKRRVNHRYLIYEDRIKNAYFEWYNKSEYKKSKEVALAKQKESLVAQEEQKQSSISLMSTEEVDKRMKNLKRKLRED